MRSDSLKLVDVNLLLYATNPGVPEHGRASAWFDGVMNSGERIALPTATLLSFLRQSTQAAIYRPPLSMQTAVEFVQDWLEWDTVWVPQPTDDHMKIVLGFLGKVPRSGLVTDAHLAALSIEHGLTICSNDRDFRLFDGVRLLNPLE